MIWLPIGIVIGVVVSIVGGILAMCVAGRRADRREIAEGWRRADFHALVGMECAHRDRLAIARGEHDYEPNRTYACAMRVDPKCLPDSLLLAAWEFVNCREHGRDPDWVRYVPEGEGS